MAGGERWGAEQSHEELCHVAAQEGLLQRCATPDGEAAIGCKDWSVFGKDSFLYKKRVIEPIPVLPGCYLHHKL